MGFSPWGLHLQSSLFNPFSLIHGIEEIPVALGRLHFL
jgi:hypothetical protein